MDQRGTILIVDDNEINRAVLRDILSEEYQVLEAENGLDALELLEQHETEIEGIVLDLIMPKMDGYGFLEFFHQQEQWKSIPVVVASIDGGPEVEDLCLTLGAWDFVQKPYNPATLSLRLRNSISRRRLHLMEQQRLTDTFQRYVDPSIMKELLKEGVSPLELQGKNVEIAVLFVDMRGFTALSERLEPQEIVGILNEYLTLTSRAIKQYGGTLDKFIGDCTMAFWGAPLPCQDSVYQACQAAVAMAEESAAMNERLLQRFGRRISYGIGIHVGPAVVGNIGSPERMDYTAIGDTVNTASRLESNAPPGTIYISREVADRLGSRAAVTSLGDAIPLKGKSAGFEVLTLDALYAPPPPLQPERPSEEDIWW